MSKLRKIIRMMLCLPMAPIIGVGGVGGSGSGSDSGNNDPNNTDNDSDNTNNDSNNNSDSNCSSVLSRTPTEILTKKLLFTCLIKFSSKCKNFGSQNSL